MAKVQLVNISRLGRLVVLPADRAYAYQAGINTSSTSSQDLPSAKYRLHMPPSMGLGRQRARFSIPLPEPVDKVVRNPKPLGRLPHRFVVQILYDPFPYI